MKYLIEVLIFSVIFIGVSTSVFAQDLEESINHFNKRELILERVSGYLKDNENYQLSIEEQTIFESKFVDAEEQGELYDKEEMKEKYIRNLLVQQFFVQNPDLNEDLDKTTFSYPDPCFRGDFETGSLVTFEGYAHVGTNSMQCDQIPLDVPSDATYFPIPMTGTEDEFTLMGAGADPIVPASALQMTNGGSLGSLRINHDSNGGEDISVLRKNFSTPITGGQIVSFSAAIVLEAPHNSPYDSFMTARIISSTGAVVGGPICITPTSPDVVWNPFSYSGPHVWMDWKCFQIPYYGIMGENYVLEISVGDCGYTGHGGYAYIDDICNVVCAPINTGCCEADAGLVLSWTEVPGALSYEVDFFFNDPDCCTNGDAPIGTSVITADNAIMPPSGFSDCFSWRVRGLFPDGTKTEFSAKLCDCHPDEEICEAPTNLDCEHIDNHRRLSWDPVVGALGGYVVEITYNDPACPGCSGVESTTTINTMDTWVDVIDVSTCFSWRVRTICNTASISDWSPSVCACPHSTFVPQTNIKSGRVESDLKLTVVPNPASEFVSITMSNSEKVGKGEVNLIIFGSAGKKKFQSPITENETLKIDVSEFESGIYIFSLIQDGAVIESGKLILE